MKLDSIAYANQHLCQVNQTEVSPWNWANHWILETARLDGSQTVIDLGAGHNPVIQKALKEQAKQAYLVDLLPIDSSDLPSHFKTIQSGIDSVPLPDSCADIIISISTFEHLPHESQIKVFQESARLLKPGGHFIFSYGVIMRANRRAQHTIEHNPEFKARHCEAYLPLNLPQVIHSTPKLKLANTNNANGLTIEDLPGGQNFNEDRLLDQKDLNIGRYADYPKLAADPDLNPVVWTEVGLWLTRVN